MTDKEWAEIEQRVVLSDKVTRWLRANVDILIEAMNNDNVELAVFTHFKLDSVLDEMLTPMLQLLSIDKYGEGLEAQITAMDRIGDRYEELNHQWAVAFAERTGM